MGYGRFGFQWAPYVPVRQKLAMATKQAAQLAKKQKRAPSPVIIEGRKITTSFWGKAWCDNLESYSDFSNRLERGATYVRNGSVVDLMIKKGHIEAIVAGSVPYTVKITIQPLAKTTWQKIIKECSASIDSLMDLLSGRLSDRVMRRLTSKKDSLLPSPSEIEMRCTCPDFSYCCKHIAAVMYGVGSRLDKQPELLFLLRGVDHQELVRHAVSKVNLDRELKSSSDSDLSGQDLGAIFGIELDRHTPSSAKKTRSPNRSKSRAPAKVKAIGTRKKSSRGDQSIEITVNSKIGSVASSRRRKTAVKPLKDASSAKSNAFIPSSSNKGDLAVAKRARRSAKGKSVDAIIVPEPLKAGATRRKKRANSKARASKLAKAC